MRELKITPENMVESGRVMDFGLFKSPFTNVNILEADIYPDKKIPKFLRKYRLKEWQHYVLINDEISMGFVISDTHYMTMSFCYLVNRKNGEFFEHHREKFGKKIRLSKELWNDKCEYISPDYALEFHNNLSENRHQIKIRIRRDGNKEAIKADLTIHENLDSLQPLVTVLPINSNRPLYTHKAACPVSGEVSVGKKTIKINAENDIALVDVQKTYYPYNTHWRWSTFAGYDKNRNLLAINLVKNMIQDDENYNENVFWVNGKLNPLSAAQFIINKSNFMDEWKISTTDGKCDLTFKPLGERSDRINMGLIMSDYHQPYGKYYGTMIDSDGKSYEIDGIHGVTEHHLAKF